MSRCTTGWRVTKLDPAKVPDWVGNRLWIAENPRGIAFSCISWDAAIAKVCDDLRRRDADSKRSAVGVGD